VKNCTSLQSGGFMHLLASLNYNLI